MRLRRFLNAGAVFANSMKSYKDFADQGYTVSSVTTSKSPFGSSIVFNGTTSLITTGTDFVGAGDVSVSAWIKYAGAGGGTFGRICDTTKFIFYVLDSNKTINLSSDGGVTNSVSGINAAVLNTWVHILVTRTSAGVTNFYANGVLSGTANQSSGTPSSGTSFSIGNRTTLDRCFNGQMSNLLVFNRILNTNEITALSQNKCFDYTKNIVCRWNMGQTNPVDVGWRNLQLNGTGANVTVSSYQSKNRGALTFNGTTSIVTVPHDVNQLLTSGGTISGWIKPISLGENSAGRIIAKSADTSSNNGYILSTTSPNRLAVSLVGSASAYSANDSVTLNTWQHVIVTFNSAGATNFYINGVLSGTPNQATAAASGITYTGNLNIGNEAGTSRTFDGDISDVIIFDKVLTALEVRDLYESTK